MEIGKGIFLLFKDTIQKLYNFCLSNRIIANGIKKILSNTTNNSLWKGVFLLGFGTIFAQIIIVLTTPILTRLYTPSDFGVLGIYNSILAIIITVISFRYELAIPVPVQPKKAANLFILSVMIVGILSVIFSVFLMVFSDHLEQFFNITNFNVFFWLLIIGCFGSGIYQALNYWAIRIQDYPGITYTRLNQSVSGTSCKILCGLFNAGSLGLLLGSLIANAAGIGTLLKNIKKEWPLFKSVALSDLKIVAREFKDFPVFSAPATLLYTLSLQLPIFFITLMYGIAEVGWYTIAFQVLALPSALIGSSIAQVFYGEAAKTMNDDPNKLKVLYLDTVKKLTLFAIPIIGFLALLAPFVFPIILGESWRIAGLYVLPLAIYAISDFITVPTNKLAVYGYNKWQFFFNAIRFIIIICGFFGSYLLHLSILITLFLYGFLSTLSYVALFYLNISAINHLISQHNTHQNIA